jgi:signal transduction histidine kinase
MGKFEITPKRALILFIAIAVVLIGQAVWWVIFMARLVNEKVQMAIDLGADPGFVDLIHEQEIRRQIMVGSEGLFLLFLVGVGAWLIYRALVRAEELKFQQQNFLMAVTHELKTPLASIKIYLDTLESAKVASEKKAGIIPRLKQDANRLEKLVENVLEAGRFERSRYHLNQERFCLSRLVDDVLNALADYPSESSVQLSKEPFDDAVEIYGDRSALKRALGAILENALIYNDKDVIKVKVGLGRKDERIFLNIADNGTGLLKKDLDRIFHRFYRVETGMNHSVPGTGLGLYLCREIINAHGGRITARSDGAGRGTEFLIHLKATIPDEEDSTC